MSVWAYIWGEFANWDFLRFDICKFFTNNKNKEVFKAKTNFLIRKVISQIWSQFLQNFSISMFQELTLVALEVEKHFALYRL